jgi:hypothetical protein
MLGVIMFLSSFLLLFFGIIYGISYYFLRYLNVKSCFKKSFYATFLFLFCFVFLIYLSHFFEVLILEEIAFLLFLAVIFLFIIDIFIIILVKILKKKLQLKYHLFLLLFVFFIVFGYGLYNGNTYDVVEVEIENDKISSDYRFVLISDLHVDSASGDLLERVVDDINELNVDYVFITGDLVDDYKLDSSDLDAFKDLNAENFFIYGNHERISDKTNGFFDDVKYLNTLDNEVVSLEEIEIVGVNNYRGERGDSYNVSLFLDNVVVDDSKFLVLLNHEPVFVDLVSKKGFDLMLSGHTHNGQIWPLGYIAKMIYGYSYGLYEIGDMQLYLTSGTQTWGPPFRLGTDCEIVLIKVKSV